VAAGVGAIMSFHGSMPALDSTGAPGTLSPRVLTGLLRGELGFNGVVISDAMDMQGVLVQYGAVEAAKRAVAAGADVLIQPRDVGQAIDAIVDGVHEGRYTEARLDASVRRLLAMKHALKLDRERLVDLDSVSAIVGDSANQALARTVAERSITVVRDSLRQLPLGRLNKAARVLSITLARRADLGAGVTFNAVLRQNFPGLRAEYVDADQPDVPPTLLSTADSADVVIVSSYVAQSWDAASLNAPGSVVSFMQRLKRPIIVALGNPYFLQQIPWAQCYVVAWGGFPVSQQAAARVILGQVPATGRLPISIPSYASYGSGLSFSTLP
jgi:beta-N-acetylhexosaminidase